MGLCHLDETAETYPLYGLLDRHAVGLFCRTNPAVEEILDELDEGELDLARRRGVVFQPPSLFQRGPQSRLAQLDLKDPEAGLAPLAIAAGPDRIRRRSAALQHLMELFTAQAGPPRIARLLSLREFRRLLEVQKL